MHSFIKDTQQLYLPQVNKVYCSRHPPEHSANKFKLRHLSLIFMNCQLWNNIKSDAELTGVCRARSEVATASRWQTTDNLIIGFPTRHVLFFFKLFPDNAVTDMTALLCGHQCHFKGIVRHLGNTLISLEESEMIRSILRMCLLNMKGKKGNRCISKMSK